MKTMKTMLVGMLLTPALLNAQSKEYTVNVKMSPKTDGTNVFFQVGNGKTDTAQLVNGQCRFKGMITDASSAAIVVEHPVMQPNEGDYLEFYVEGGKINITTDQLISKAVVSGTKVNEDAKVYEQQVGPAKKKASDIMQDYMRATAEKRADTAWMNSFPDRYNSAQREERLAKIAYIRQHPNQLLSLVVLKEMLITPYDSAARQLFDGLAKHLRDTETGVALNKAITAQRDASVGAMAADFTANDVNDKPVKLSDFRGKYVLLDFWASWCEPCRAENPHVVKAFNRFKDKNFTVLSFSLDQPGGKKRWLSAIKDDELTWTNVSELAFWDSKAVKLYGIRGVPANFLIDPSGKIVAKDLRGEALESKLAEILK